MNRSPQADQANGHGKTRENIDLAHGEISREVIGAFFHVYNTLGYGLAESVYQRSIAIAIEMRGVTARREVPLHVVFEGRAVGEYRADLIVAERILVETKSTERLLREHEAQVYNYLKISGLRVGLLLNFGPKQIFRRLLRPISQLPLR